MRFLAAVPLVCALVIGAADGARAIGTDEVYAAFSPAVVQVRIQSAAASSKASIGSGFFVDESGLLVTNYHVISDVVHHPDKFRATLVERGDEGAALRLVDFDVVHDLALLVAPATPEHVLRLSEHAPAKGTRLFSLGNPLDLGTSIVEGTYNGLLEDSLYERIHFTGAINPGMSGGPVVDESGRVVGVNVATAGNEVGFLVPASFASALVARAQAEGAASREDFSGLVREQLLANQETLAGRLLQSTFEDVVLGDFRVPGRLARFVKCWGGEDTTDKRRFRDVVQSCSTEDSIYVSNRLSSGSIEFEHHWFHSQDLNVLQFYSMLEDRFAGAGVSAPAAPDLLTRFECTTGFVEQGGMDLKVVYCLRGYKKLADLYDVLLLAASLSSNRSALQSRLEMRGVSFENARLLSRRFLESIRWNPSS